MYNYLEKLGEGSFGSVWKVEKTDTSQIIALKTINFKRKADEKLKPEEREKQKEIIKQLALREVELLKKISNPCIESLTCFYDSHLENDKMLIEMEYIDGVPLDSFAETYRGVPLLYRYLLAILKDIIPGIEYLHNNGIIHRDIKPANIIIDINDQPKLIDIGLACETIECPIDKPCCVGRIGTALYMAPETILNNISYFASDIYSLGVTFYYVAKGEHIYFPLPKDRKQLITMVEYFEIEPLDTKNTKLNVLVNKMLIRNTDKRITAKQIDEYINEVNK